MVRLICLTEHYSSTDEGAGFSVSEGDEFSVSDAKAEQMLSDFPDWFRRIEPRTAQPATKTRPARQKP